MTTNKFQKYQTTANFAEISAWGLRVLKIN